MVQVGPNWANALKSWQCPTPAALSNGSCDPCGVNVWWVPGQQNAGPGLLPDKQTDPGSFVLSSWVLLQVWEF